VPHMTNSGDCLEKKTRRSAGNAMLSLPEHIDSGRHRASSEQNRISLSVSASYDSVRDATAFGATQTWHETTPFMG
jgi:hypothetical protein